NAAIDRVFEVYSRYANFPRFMRHVLDVQDQGNGRSRWIVAGPAGFPIEFETRVTRHDENSCVAWETVEGSSIRHRGEARFEDAGDGTTRVHIHMTYAPPAGMLGHAIASLFGADPK